MCKAIDDLENDARNEGIIVGKAESILELLEDYGQISNELKAKIFAQKDLEVLRKWHKLAARSVSIQEFMQNIQYDADIS